MLRALTISSVAALAVVVGITAAQAAPDPATTKATEAVAASAEPAKPQVQQIAEAARPKQTPFSSKDEILYSIITDQISQMRRKSALPATMCIAASNADGSAETVSRGLMARLEADNAKVENSLFTLKQANACETSGQRMVDSETHERAMMIVAGPMETDMQQLMSGCGDYVGGFVRATGDSDFDFYSVNGGDVARKLGCELAH
jgi:hypothetical protein